MKNNKHFANLMLRSLIGLLVLMQTSIQAAYAYEDISSELPSGTPAALVGAGMYDDADANWVYNGSWTAATGSGAYNGTIHYSLTPGQYSEFTFSGMKFKLFYTLNSYRGSMDVYVDGAKVTTINQYSGTWLWQQTWTSSVYASGPHTVRLVHASGTSIDIDAIQIFEASDTIPPAAVSDLAAVGGSMPGTVNLVWTAPGDDGSTGTATSYLVRYNTSAISDETAWNAATSVSTGIPVPAGAGTAQNMVVTGLTGGMTYYFSIRAVDEDGNPGGLSNSPSAVAATAMVMGSGKYDDTHAAWIYNGSWTATTGSGAYNGTIHYSLTIGRYAEFTFSGSKFTLTFTRNSYRGNMDVYVDNVKATTVNEYSGTWLWQQTWTSDAYPNATHTVKLVHASGTAIDIDAIQIEGPTDTVPPAAITNLAAVTGSTQGTVDLSWTAPGDDGNTGTATSYLVRYSTSAINGETAWNTAAVVTAGIPAPAAAGTAQTMVVGGLNGGTTYYFSMRAKDEDGNPGGLSNSPNAVANNSANMVLNDDFNDAIIISSVPYTNSQITNGATTAGDDPVFSGCGNGSGYKTVWYAFTPVLNDTLVLDTYGTNFDTVLAVWTGVRGALVQRICNDDTGGPQSYIELDVTAGTTYYIEVAGFSSLSYGTLVLHASLGRGLGAGKYDDTHAGWVYTGIWTAAGSSGAYNGTIHYSLTIGQYAQFAFKGTKFTLTFTKNSYRGNMDVYVDNVKVTTINQYSNSWLWQQTWTSAVYPNGAHTVKLVHASGTSMDIDAIQIYAPADSVAPAAITNLSAVTGTTYGCVNLGWTSPGDDGNTGTATSYLVRYSTIAITNDAGWNTASVVSTGIPVPALAGTAQNMIVSGLIGGTTYYFNVRAMDEDGNLGGLSNSPGAAANNSAVGAGKYDDTHASWLYTGSWTAASGSGAYNGTIHYSLTLGQYAEFIFSGNKFTLFYTRNTYRGSMDVYVDGIKEITINQYNSSWLWQQSWTSDLYPNATHTVKLVHAGGTAIDIDAIQVYSPADSTPPAAITTLAAVTGGSYGTVNLNWTAPGDDGNTGTATSYLVAYNTSAISDVSAWNAATMVTSGVPTPAGAGTPQSMIVGGLIGGNTYYFAVRAMDEDGNLGGLSNSPSGVASSAAVGAGIYDDTDSGWVYNGTWTAAGGSGAYNGTIHYSLTTGQFAEFSFNGSKFKLYHTMNTYRGSMDVYVDGVKATTINQYSTSWLWQQTWSSGVYPKGAHLVRLVHASGTSVDIDAIQVLAATDNVPPAAINTLAAVPGDTPGAVKLNWTAPGDDGNSGMATAYLVRYSTSVINNESDWNASTTVTTGLPPTAVAGTVQNMIVTGLTGGNTYYFSVRAMDDDGNLGGLSNSPSAVASAVLVMGAGTYDDTYVAWVFNGTWTSSTGSGAYNGTIHYSLTIGQYAEFTFNGTKVTLTFTKNSYRGSMDIYIDGVKVTTLDQYDTIWLWQQTWTSSIYAYGRHTVKFQHASGTAVDVDAIQVYP